MVTDLAEKRRGLELLARKHEPQPETVLAPSRATKNPCERSESYASQSTPSAENKDRKRNNENEVTFRLGGF